LSFFHESKYGETHTNPGFSQDTWVRIQIEPGSEMGKPAGESLTE
jgi:hypothetical protein